MERSGSEAIVARVFNVVGFAGSLRRGSYNRALLRTARELAAPTLNIDIHELDGIPLYNGDAEASSIPPSVLQLREAIGKGGCVTDRYSRVQPRSPGRVEEHDRLVVPPAE